MLALAGRNLSASRRLVMKAHRVSEGDHRPDGGENDHCEKKELRGHARPLASRVAFADKAKGAQAQRSLRIKQSIVHGIGA